MTAEEADAIYYKATAVEYLKYKHAYEPVNQRKVDLAGMQAVIDAVKSEMTAELASQYLNSLTNNKL